MQPWMWIVCILGIVVALHIYIFLEWRHKTLAQAITLVSRGLHRPRDLLSRDEALMNELRQRVTRLQEAPSSHNKEDETHA